jgi:hypothetical protein
MTNNILSPGDLEEYLASIHWETLYSAAVLVNFYQNAQCHIPEYANLEKELSLFSNKLCSFLAFFFLWGRQKLRLAHCSHSRLIVLNPALVLLFISRGAPHQTA